MARITKSEYPKIQHMAAVEKRKVQEIAALYGCTPANIYAILAKLRRQGGAGTDTPLPEPAVVSEQPAGIVAPPVETSCPGPESTAPADLFASLDQETARTAQPEAASGQCEEPEPPEARSSTPTTPYAKVPTVLPQAEMGTPTAAPVIRAAATLPAKTSARVRTSEALTPTEARLSKAAKPGFALYMRTSDGDESSTPFRSLDDLLSAARPILRSAARSPDPIWFSIQPVDLADMDSEAA